MLHFRTIILSASAKKDRLIPKKDRKHYIFDDTNKSDIKNLGNPRACSINPTKMLRFIAGDPRRTKPQANRE